MENEEEEITQSDVVEALETIGKNDPDGLIEPGEVVEAARDPDSPLHRYFEWDDTAAAEAYRLAQARHLIARVRVIVVDRGPALVNVRITTAEGETRRGYVPTERAVADPDLCAQVMAEARAGIAAYRARLSAFEAARSAVGHLDAALREMG